MGTEIQMNDEMNQFLAAFDAETKKLDENVRASRRGFDSTCGFARPMIN